MKHQRLMATGILLCGMTLVGCAKDKPAEPMVPDRETGLPATKPAAAMPAKVMTHVVTAEQPYYTAPGSKEAGTFKAGTRVLLLIPGSMAQVETADGKTVYTKIDSLESVDSFAPPKATTPMAATRPVTKGEPLTPVKPEPVATPGKEMTHMLSKEQPYFTAMPAKDAKPAGKLAAGEKVLLVIPASPYCQVETSGGAMVYTPIDGVDLIPAKK